MEQSNIDTNLVNTQNKQPLPNAVATLVLGILSIVMCWCYGLVPVALGIIALAISQRSVKLYKENPELYSDYNNLRAGRITAIIGLCLSILFLILLIIVIITDSSSLSPNIFDNF